MSYRSFSNCPHRSTFRRFRAWSLPSLWGWTRVQGPLGANRLVQKLRKDFDIGSLDARARCAEFFREPLNVADRRESLMKKQERLQKAQELLANAAI